MTTREFLHRLFLAAIAAIPVWAIASEHQYKLYEKCGLASATMLIALVVIDEVDQIIDGIYYRHKRRKNIKRANGAKEKEKAPICRAEKIAVSTNRKISIRIGYDDEKTYKQEKEEFKNFFENYSFLGNEFFGENYPKD